jgi:hypothetical protein
MRRLRRDDFTWPILARAGGVGLGIVELAAWLLGKDPNSAVMTFAGALILVPNAAGPKHRKERP